MLAACASGIGANRSFDTGLDPPSVLIDPPPGPLDYLAALPARRWSFGHLLWSDRDPCTAESCEAGFNDDPVYLLVTRERACCGGPGYTLSFEASAAHCQGTSYYIIWSMNIERIRPEDRPAFLARHADGVVTMIRNHCNLPPGVAIPTAELSRLLP